MSLITWSPTDKGAGVILSNNNMTAVIPNYNNIARATVGKNSGKWYWEVTVDDFVTRGAIMIGIVNNETDLNVLSYDKQTVRYYEGNGIKRPENTSFGSPYNKQDIIGVVLDLNEGTLGFYVNGVFQGNSHSNILSIGKVFPALTSGGSSTGNTSTANFGATLFKYPVPEGYLPYDIENSLWWLGKNLVTWSPIDKSTAIVLSNNNLTVDTSTTLGHIARATQGKNFGKWYYEIVLGSGTVGEIGFAELGIPLNTDVRADLRKRGYRPNNGNKTSTNVGGTTWKEGCVTGDVVGVTIDFDSGLMNIYRNGVDLGVIFNDIKTLQFPLYPYTLGSSSSSATKLVHTTNFGATPFNYPIPKGYLPYDYENADWFIENKNLIFLDGRYYAFVDNKFIEIEPTKDNFELYGKDLLNIVTTPTDTVVVTMDEGNIVGEGKEFKKSFNMVDFKNKYGEIKEINEI